MNHILMNNFTHFLNCQLNFMIIFLVMLFNDSLNLYSGGFLNGQEKYVHKIWLFYSKHSWLRHDHKIFNQSFQHPLHELLYFSQLLLLTWDRICQGFNFLLLFLLCCQKRLPSFKTVQEIFIFYLQTHCFWVSVVRSFQFIERFSRLIGIFLSHFLFWWSRYRFC